MEETKPNYYAILPADVRYDKNLTAKEKLLYAEITALSNKEGYCWASNSYFAELYNTTDRTIRTCITNLVNNGYINRELIYKKDGKEVEKRILTLRKNFSVPQEENFLTPQEENFLYNNTSINTINIIKEKTNKKEKSDGDYKFNFSEYEIDDLEEFVKPIQDWMDYKKEKHNKYTTKGFQMFVKRLIKLSSGRYELAREIVDISIANNYQGIFPLKGRVV